MADRVEVSNLTLAKLGETRKLTDPLDDTRAARAISRVWDSVRDIALRAHLWNFALARARLSAVGGAPVFGWSHRFALPGDFIRLEIDTLEPWSVRGEHSIEGGYLLANFLGPIDIRYVRRVTEVGLWDALFVDYFSNLLGEAVADDITGDLARRDRLSRAAERSLVTAKGIDGRENPPEAALDSSWVTARYGR